MSEQKKETIVQIQARTKPKIEEIIPEYLDGESKQSLIDLLEFCYANGIKIKWAATNRWGFVFKSVGIGMIYIGKSPCMPKTPNGGVFEKNKWYTAVHLETEVVEKENLAEVIYRNVLPCVRGPKACCDTVTILGKEFENRCPESGSRFANPDAETLGCIKKLLEYKINHI